jgi:hypothetical protein
LFIQSLSPRRIDRRGAIADRVGNVKIHAGQPADLRREAGAIRAITAELTARLEFALSSP